jgi:uncharacterized sulfatase
VIAARARRRRGTRPRAALAAALALGAAALALGAAGCAPDAGDGVPERPGIVLVIGDDVGWADYGFMGSAVARTPHLDALAAEGVVFTHGFTPASICQPSLQTLLTGLEPYLIERRLARERRAGRGTPPFAEVFATLPEILAERGYVAFEGGKFWEGDPLASGFTHAMTEWPPWRARPMPLVMRQAGGYGLALGRETLDPLFEFLDAHGEEPFFVWYAPMLPHVPFDAPPRYAELYRDAPIPGHARGYYANLTRFDDTVGQVLAYLDRRGLRSRTAVLYVVDNGWNASEPPSVSARGLGGEGAKLSIREAGFRTPVVVSWPGVLPQGRRDGRLVSLGDVFATLLDLAGAAPPTDSDGRSLLPWLTGGDRPARALVVGGGTGLRDGPPGKRSAPRQRDWYVRTPEWRYVFSGREGREALYRIGEDPGEERDLAAAHPEVLAELRSALLARIEAMDRAAGETGPD